MKKNPRIDLKKKRTALLWLGRAFALGLVAIAFEFATFPSVPSITGDIIMEGELIELPPVTMAKVIPPPPPPIKNTIIEVVEDTKELPNEVEFEDTEVTDDTAVDVLEIAEIEEVIVEEELPLVRSEISPSFPGGNNALLKYLGNNIKYPRMAVESNISGRVYLQFVVEKDGSISTINVVRGIGGGCNEEAVRVLKSMPKWSAGRQQGKAVRVMFTLPVNFVLQ